MRWTLLLFSTALLHADVTVVLRTDIGDIEIAVDEQHAPATSKNFLRYVREGAYNNGRFHRTVTLQNQPQNKVKIEVIQGGTNESFQQHEPIPIERTSTTGLKHVDGAISMARDGPDTATSDFFICIGNQPELDFAGKRNPDGQGFAAFGRVTKGMEVVRAIQASAAEGQTLKPPVRIVKAAIK